MNIIVQSWKHVINCVFMVQQEAIVAYNDFDSENHNNFLLERNACHRSNIVMKYVIVHNFNWKLLRS